MTRSWETEEKTPTPPAPPRPGRSWEASPVLRPTGRSWETPPPEQTPVETPAKAKWSRESAEGPALRASSPGYIAQGPKSLDTKRREYMEYLARMATAQPGAVGIGPLQAYGMIRHTGKQLGEEAEAGIKKLRVAIPGTEKSVPLTIPGTAPAAKFVIEMATDPITYIVGGAIGKIGGKIGTKLAAAGVEQAAAKAAGEGAKMVLDKPTEAVAGAGLNLYKIYWQEKAAPIILDFAKRQKFKLLRKLPESWQEGMVYRWGIPRSMTRLLDRYHLNVGKGYDELSDIGETFRGLSLAERQAATEYARGARPGRSIRDIVEGMPKSITGYPEKVRDYIRSKYLSVPEGADVQKIRAAGEAARGTFMAKARQAYQEGLMSEETFVKHYGRYLPQFYETMERDPVGGKAVYEALLKKYGIQRPTGIEQSRWSYKQDLPQEVRDQLGEILDIEYLTMKGGRQEVRSIETARLYGDIAKNPNLWRNEARPGWLSVPNDPDAYGELAGGYASPGTMRGLKEMEWWSREGAGMWKSAMSRWKYLKVVVSPSTWFRNAYTNVILNDAGGLPFYRSDVYIKALKDYADKGPLYRAVMRESNVLRGTHYGAEIRDVLNRYKDTPGLPGSSMMDAMADVTRWMEQKKVAPHQIYQAVEKWHKLAHVMWKVENEGMTVRQAARSAEKYLFDYNKIPNVVRAFREGWAGAPFITFDFKAIPLLAEKAVKDPMWYAKWGAITQGVERVNAAMAGTPWSQVKEEKKWMPEWAAAQSIIPRWMSDMAKKIPVPGLVGEALDFITPPGRWLYSGKDKTGKSSYVDIGYISPGAGIYRLNDLVFHGPASLGFELMNNLDAFTKKPIYHERVTTPDGKTTGPSWLEQKTEIASWLIKKLGPGVLMPAEYTYKWLAEEPAGYRKEDMPTGKQVLGRWAGIKTKMFDSKRTKAQWAEKAGMADEEWRAYQEQQKAIKEGRY